MYLPQNIVMWTSVKGCDGRHIPRSIKTAASTSTLLSSTEPGRPPQPAERTACASTSGSRRPYPQTEFGSKTHIRLEQPYREAHVRSSAWAPARMWRVTYVAGVLVSLGGGASYYRRKGYWSIGQGRRKQEARRTAHQLVSLQQVRQNLAPHCECSSPMSVSGK
jgi:hypothetical protein